MRCRERREWGVVEEGEWVWLGNLLIVGKMFFYGAYIYLSIYLSINKIYLSKVPSAIEPSICLSFIYLSIYISTLLHFYFPPLHFLAWHSWKALLPAIWIYIHIDKYMYIVYIYLYLSVSLSLSLITPTHSLVCEIAVNNRKEKKTNKGIKLHANKTQDYLL